MHPAVRLASLLVRAIGISKLRYFLSIYFLSPPLSLPSTACIWGGGGIEWGGREELNPQLLENVDCPVN